MSPKVLQIGDWPFSESAWSRLSEVALVVKCDSKDREAFLNDLKGKYKDVTHIARTFASAKVTGRFDEEIAASLPKTVKAISHCGAGYDQVDVKPLTVRKIQLSNVTTPVENPTATTAIYLLLGALRNYQEGHDLLTAGNWEKKSFAGAKIGHDPEGKVVGIIGMGGIGRAIRDRLVPFNFAKILYYNRTRLAPELEGGSEYVTLDTLLKESDIIMLSLPLNSNTRHFVNEATIEKMKKGVVLVNTARGAVIDEKALKEGLKLGHIGAIGSDVFENEPQTDPELIAMPNVVSLPHMGTYTEEAIRNMEEFTVENVRTHIETGVLMTVVPEQKGMNVETWGDEH